MVSETLEGFRRPRRPSWRACRLCGEAIVIAETMQGTPIALTVASRAVRVELVKESAFPRVTYEKHDCRR